MSSHNRRHYSDDVHILGTLSTQGGGHGKIKVSHSSRLNADILAKPLIEREAHFYQEIVKSPLRKWVPAYHGVAAVDENSNLDKFLLLEDLTSGFSSPCIADIKIGTRSFEVDASEEKKRAQLSHIRGTTTESHACRMVDVSLRKEGVLIKDWDRVAGRRAPISKFVNVMKEFLPGRRKNEFLKMLNKLIKKLITTKNLYPKSRFYSASLLVIYDGDHEEKPMKMAIIDFAHAYIDIEAEGGDAHDQSYDDNTVKGLQNLYNIVHDN